MPRINVLPKSVAELIAAGEVVERPSSAVKELIENSIDAGSSAITVEIKNGGVKYIRVTDNGCGIDRDDVRKAFTSHGTSKIRSGEDLDAIFTLGFRGEALPSIAAVSRLSMLTKTAEDSIGTGIEIAGGEELSFDDAGCPDGTTVIVRDLFYNTPARMKFLKKDMTEGSYVTDVVQKTALSHPEIKFTLIKDGKNVLMTQGNGDLRSAVYNIFGKEISEALIPVEYEYQTIKIKGFVSRPLNNRPNRNMQFVFVNGRYVRVPVAAAALDEAYKNRIMVGKFPMCFLFIDIPAGKVDVNVHPAKTEIRFSEDSKIFETVFYSVKSALNKGDDVRPEISLREKRDITAKKEPEPVQMRFSQSVLNNENNTPVRNIGPLTPKKQSFSSESNSTVPVTPVIPEKREVPKQLKTVMDAVEQSFPVKTEEASVVKEEAEEKRTAAVPVIDITAEDEENFSVNKPFSLPEKDRVAVFRDTSGIFNNMTPKEKVTEENERYYIGKQEEKPAEDTPFVPDNGIKNEEIRIVGEVFSTYILVEKGDKLLVIDKHAAHERMIFNSLMSEKEETASQLLLSPVAVTLSGKEYAAVLENTEVFLRGGFAVEDFGGGTVIVRECPVTLQKEDISSIITEMAGELLKGNMRPVPEKLTWLYHSTACRAAIKAGDRLKKEETEVFIKKLLSDDSIRYCPHGRPVMYELTKREIEKQFGRV
ncbi:MAG: DNA mismatch repair endonuclease MutL [Ruminococcaceae bacterium]|nr:DNA mismatch repair endonuclease MutL [Oscillospiraceae bacterium]